MKRAGRSIVTCRLCNSPTVCLSHGALLASAHLASSWNRRSALGFAKSHFIAALYSWPFQLKP
jgi:hypothetical protein